MIGNNLWKAPNSKCKTLSVLVGTALFQNDTGNTHVILVPCSNIALPLHVLICCDSLFYVYRAMHFVTTRLNQHAVIANNVLRYSCLAAKTTALLLRAQVLFNFGLQNFAAKWWIPELRGPAARDNTRAVAWMGQCVPEHHHHGICWQTHLLSIGQMTILEQICDSGCVFWILTVVVSWNINLQHYEVDRNFWDQPACPK